MVSKHKRPTVAERTALKRELNRLQSALKERDGVIDRLRMDLAAFKNEVVVLKDSKSENDQLIENLRSQLQSVGSQTLAEQKKVEQALTEALIAVKVLTKFVGRA